jgi:hypothetical protein
MMLGAIETAPAFANKEKRRRTERQVSDDYQTPAVAVHPIHPPPPAVTVCNRGGALGGNRGCVVFDLSLKERFIDVEVVDATGLPVPFFVAEGEELQDGWDGFCGKTERPLRVAPGPIFVILYAYSPVGVGPCTGATTGTVKATISNLP